MPTAASDCRTSRLPDRPIRLPMPGRPSRSSLGPVCIWAVAAAGAAAILFSLYQLVVHPITSTWLILAALTLVSSSATLRMSIVPASLSIAEAFSFAALLAFGPAAGTLTVALDALGVSFRLARRRLVFRRLIFNATAPALAMWVAAHVLFAVADVPALAHPTQFPALLLPLALCAGIYFSLDTGLIALAVALEERRSLFHVWRTNFLPLWLGFFGGAYAAAALVVYMRHMDARFLAIVAPLPFILYYALRTWLERVDERTQHLATLDDQARKLREQQLLRQQAEAALRERDEQFRAVFGHALDALVVVDDERRFLDANPAAFRLLGTSPEELRLRRIDDFLEPDFASVIDIRWQTFLERGEAQGEWRVRTADAKSRIVEYTSKAHVLPGRHLAIWRDVTERRDLEEQFRQAQKMETVGRLAGGVAHDFNNLLTAILGYTTLVLDRVSGPIREDVEEIYRAAERATALTRQLLAFSRKQVLQPAIVDLNDVVAGLDKMLRRLLAENIEVRTFLASNLWPVKVDPGQLELVILNLVVNARDAMPKGGRLTVRTENTLVEVPRFEHGFELLPGPYAVLTITDTGCGMEDAVKSHLFEPFFTTKEPGKGTGLGLATVYGIIKQSGGCIQVESAPGAGSSLHIHLPWAERSVEQPQVAAAPRSKPLDGSETVLLAEDETAVRTLARSVLERHGYRVLEARNGAEALALVQQFRSERVDLVLTDLVMPVMGGQELVRWLTPRLPDLKVIYVTGHTDEAIVQTGPTGAEPAVLYKPFTPAVLAQVVRNVLDGRIPAR